MHTLLTLNTARRDDGERLIAAGEIDLSNVDAFRQALADAIATATGSGGVLTVDLSAVEYLDSAALSALFDCADRINKLAANPLLMDILNICGLTELVAVEALP